MGVTYVTLAPEHPLVSVITTEDEKEAVDAYVAATASKSDLTRTAAKEKTGVFTGGYAIHPITNEKVPIWIGDYVLGSYGTGAVMAVPAHDVRDFDFAKKYGLDIKYVVKPTDHDGVNFSAEEAFTEPGTTFASGDFSKLKTEVAKASIADHLKCVDMGGPTINYKLRDWVFSRQRYWGEPIPIYFPVSLADGVDPASVDLRTDENVEHTIEYNEPIPVPEEELPLTLPLMDDFLPGDDPAGCLARASDWRYFQKDGKWFARETNTMPQWAGSCWYYLRFMDPANTNEAFSKEMDEMWMPVDLYVGGAEHAVLHLLYARFWHRVLYDLGYTKHKEPFQKLVHQGMILGSDGEKMSKSRGNVVNPDDIVSQHGADALRLYEMFMGPLEAVKPWQTSQVAGVVRFQIKLYNAVSIVTKEGSKDIEMKHETRRLLHKTMKKVTEDIDNLAFNTAISAMMILTNHLQSLKDEVPREAVEKLAIMVSPFAPHLGEEAWRMLGHEETLAFEPWVKWDESLCVDTTVKMGVQVNGKVRGEIEIEKDASQDTAMERAMQQERVANQLEGKDIKKIIFVPGRILNILAK
jgi:leucyl-tRNA synthetase